MKVCHTCRYYIDGGCQVNGDFRASSGKCRKWSGRSEKRVKPIFIPDGSGKKKKQEKPKQTRPVIIEPTNDTHAPRSAHKCGICKHYLKGACQNEKSAIYGHAVKSIDWCKSFEHWKD